MMCLNKKETALEHFSKGYNCAQSVLSAFAEELKVNKEQALKLAAGFGGGLSRGEVCGAVSGAVMVLGLKYGVLNLDDTNAKEKLKELTNLFYEQFEDRNSSIICNEILGYNLSVPKELEIIKQNELFKTKCPKAVESAVTILENFH